MKATGHGSAWPGALLVLLGVLACEKPPQEASPEESDPQRVVLARVGDEVVRVEDLGFVPVRMDFANKLETLVTRKLAAEEARRRGLAEEPKTREKLAQFRNSARMWEEGLLRNALYNSIRLGMTFSEAELRAHFEATKSRYNEPQWKLRIQKFASEAEARAAAEKLGATGRLDPAQGERLGPLPAEQLPLALMPVVHLLKQPGDRQVLDLGGQWSVIELEEHLPSAPLSFEVAREKVDQDLRAVRAEQALNQELAKLRAEQVTIDQAALAKIEQERAGRVEQRDVEREAARAERRARRARRAQAQAEAPPVQATPGANEQPEPVPPGETP